MAAMNYAAGDPSKCLVVAPSKAVSMVGYQAIDSQTDSEGESRTVFGLDPKCDF
jgi:hypothetical protein